MMMMTFLEPSITLAWIRDALSSLKFTLAQIYISHRQSIHSAGFRGIIDYRLKELSINV